MILYDQIVSWYADYLTTNEARENISEFDRLLPEYTWVSDTKKIDWMSMNEEKARTGIRVREAEKAHNIRTFSHGRGAKKKDPNCIQIRVLLWCRKRGSNPHGVATTGF